MKHNNSHSNISIEVFKTYTFEDFLLDDFFILSLRKPTYESVLFWNKYINSNPANIDSYYKAKACIDTLSENDDYLRDEEINEMWRGIQEVNENELKASRRKRNIKLLSIAAGIVAIIICLIWVLPHNAVEETSLTSFLEQTEMNKNVSDQTQLILSNNDIINLTDKESEINYTDNKIEVNNKIAADIEHKEKHEEFNQIIVPKGKRATLNFADGSRLWINSGTRVVYPTAFADNKREIYVEGEVYSEVKENKKWPFIIKTPRMSIEVLGTAFNVNAYKTDSLHSVVLVSGLVKITSERGNALLRPNDRYECTPSNSSVRIVDVAPYISWTKGIYIYQSEKLNVILDHLAKYYGVTIDCERKISELRFSGKLDLKDDLSVILSGMEKVASINIKNNNGNYTVTVKN